MEDALREQLEIAALLHDVGKIGIPDRVLQKSSHLDDQEQILMTMHVDIATEMLRGAGASAELLEILGQARAGFDTAGENLPIAARMLSIVDAFDSMTSEQVFRRALSRERAIDELFRHAGTQFDPLLVEDFAAMLTKPRPDLEATLVERWLADFTPRTIADFSEGDVPVSCGAIQNLVDTVFHRRLLDNLADAAVYVDADGQILLWNRAAERLTGRRASSLTHLTWTADLMGLSSDTGEKLTQSQCPLKATLQASVHFNTSLQIRHTDGRLFKVCFTGIPVFTGERGIAGAILLARDSSAQARLEERVQSLNELASRDMLTKVANRATLDRRLPEFLKDHLDKGQRGSLIICDIDYFKRINDNYGHQAGDEALITFASILRELAREGDLVARYGGEEFVVLCAGCDNPTATARAEEMRRSVEHSPISALNDSTMTASFGVTESQPGDTALTLLARADRALLTAKSTGRNRVVQLGAGQDLDEPEVSPAMPTPQQNASWLDWFRAGRPVTIVESDRLASVPHPIAVQKLEGFISDHRAELLKTEPTMVTLRINTQKSETVRRRGERSAIMIMEVTVTPVDYRYPKTNTYQSKTMLSIKIRATQPRDRRMDTLIGQANQLFASFNSYLMAQEITEEMWESIAEHR